MSEENAKAFVDGIRASAVACAAPTPAEQLDAFRNSVHAILSKELKVLDLTWTARRDLQFVIEEYEFRFFFDPDDPLFIIVSAGMFAWCSDEDRNRALAAASMVNHEVKAAKVIVIRKEEDRSLVGSAVEAVLPGFDFVDKAFVKRLISLARRGATEFQRYYSAQGAA